MLFGKKAKEIAGPMEWINSKPLTLAELKGKVVLLDFWTYSCINCLRTLPALKEMWRKYKNQGLVIIGIHTPEFEFEEDIENVRKAVKKQGIEYPVANDPQRVNWENYGNQYWPRSALIDKEGNIILEHIGESGYDEIDMRIQTALSTKAAPLAEHKRSYAQGISPETYAGSLRNEGIPGSVCTPEGCHEYHDPGRHKRNTIYLQGEWQQEDEFIQFNGKQGHIAYLFFASEANIVMDGKGKAEVLLNEKPIPKSLRGKDLVEEEKKTYIIVDGADLYNLFKAKSFEEGDIKVMAFKGMKVFAYTFG
jgi:thiol-disulfide isomerase/thioredoxin